MRRVIAGFVAIGALVLAAGTYNPGRGTPEDTVILQFGGSPGGIPHVGYVAPHPGRLLFLTATGHTPGQGAGTTTLAAVRADGGVMLQEDGGACAVTVPCTLGDGVYAPEDGGVVECNAPLDERERIAFEPVDDCALPPVVMMQAAFYYQ